MTVEKKLECVKLLVESIEIPDKIETRWGPVFNPPRTQVKDTIRIARRLLHEVSKDL